LIPQELLRVAKPDAELISVGKFASRHTLPQDQINALLVEKAKEGKTVARLKGGDCYLFGRGGEEALACHEAGVEFEVVPGITSALAAPCYAGIPPTHRDYTSSIAVVTGHRKDEGPIDIPKAGTVVFLMSVGNVKKIVDTLLHDGWSSRTPIAAVEHGTCYDQRVIVGQLDNFIQKVQEADLRTPAIFIVGQVVNLREELDWFGRQKNVLVLGNHPDRYGHLGHILHRRMIDCVALDDYSKVDALLGAIPSFHWIVFTSVNAARYLFDRLFTTGMDVRALGSVRIAAIGQTTGARLREYGLRPDLVPATESSAGLLEEFRRLGMAGQHVLLPRAEVSTEDLPRGLADMGATVSCVVVYRTVDIEPEEVDFDYIDQILFTSGSTVKAFIKHFGKVPDHVQCYCLGEPTLATARQCGIQAEIMPS
jgi:uroporphyrinogen III methyltransferase/synthase